MFAITLLIGFTAISRSVTPLVINAQAGIQWTKCAEKCPIGGKMVCGSDENTYQSVCHLEKQSCETKIPLKVIYPSACGCPKECKKNYNPVCATLSTSEKDKTFPNMCEYKRVRCQMKLKDKLLVFKKKGPCKKMAKCPPGCRDIYAPVCGKDDKTYSSVCALKLAYCKNNKKMGISKIGKCDRERCPEDCPVNYEPICGSDGLWHPGECEMKLTACRKGTFIKQVKRKRAKKTCGSKKCVAYCPQQPKPVCGGDGVTYTNKCQMMKENCEKGKKVKVFSDKPCADNNHSKKK